MARKLVVSVVRTVVGARLEALDLFFGLRTIALLLGWPFVAETELCFELSGPWGTCNNGKVALLCVCWLVNNCWVVGADEKAMNPLRSVQLVSDLWFFDQITSRLRTEPGFVVVVSCRDLDRGWSKYDKGSNIGDEEWLWCWCSSCGGDGGCGWLLKAPWPILLNGLWFKKAEIDSTRESYSSLPPLEDCKLPLLPESMIQKTTRSKRRRRKEQRYGVVSDKRDLFAYFTTLRQTHFRRKLQNTKLSMIEREKEEDLLEETLSQESSESTTHMLSLKAPLICETTQCLACLLAFFSFFLLLSLNEISIKSSGIINGWGREVKSK